MTRKIYRTAQGRQIDLGALQLKNENIRAVGNMDVNARGDIIDGWNKPIEPRPNAVKKKYDKQVSNVRDESVFANPPQDSAATKSAKKTKLGSVTNSQTMNDLSEHSGDTESSQEGPVGLAGAIARARQIRQETAQAPGNNNKPAVKRI